MILDGRELDHARLQYRAVADGEGPWQLERVVQVSQSGDSVALELTLERFWPDMQDTYFCYETSDGCTGWLRIDLWVSLPLAERRLGFGWGTYK